MVTEPLAPPRRVLVTGGCGFIGSHIVDECIARRIEVVVLDNLAPDVHPSPPNYLNPEATYITADVQDRQAWLDALGGVDAVCHQAARVGLGLDFADVTRYTADNDLGTAVGLGVLHEIGFEGRIVIASSMVVYGEGAYRCGEHGSVRPGPRLLSSLESGEFEPPCPECGASLSWELVTESAPVDPRNVYAATKLHQEHLCNAFAREHPNPVTSLRYHNVYGPRMPQDTPYAGVASIFRSSLEHNEAPRVFEDGGQLRDFVHVTDVANANLAALTAPTPYRGPLNVASGSPQSVGQMAAAMCAAHGQGIEPTVTGGYRAGDVRHVVASPAKATAELGFSAQVSLQDGVREFLQASLR